ncbi:MAG: molybdopterin converting factor subunit 1 [Gammaproteobacteria bacterium]
MLRILYFASLGERLGQREETVETAGLPTVDALREQLMGRGADWRAAFEQSTVMVAVNQQMADGDTPIGDGDEVAFFPPVTGG